MKSMHQEYVRRQQEAQSRAQSSASETRGTDVNKVAAIIDLRVALETADRAAILSSTIGQSTLPNSISSGGT